MKITANNTTELALVIALLTSITATVIIAIFETQSLLAASGLPALSLAIAGGLLGAKVPKQPPE
jgi:hypothetical protein